MNPSFGASPGGPGGPPPPGPWGPSAQGSAQQFGPPPSAWAQPAIGTPGADAPNFMLWIVLSIVTFSMCGSVLAIPGAILAFLAKSDWERGEHGAGRRKLGIAKALIILNFVLTALLAVAYFAFMIYVETM